MFSGIDLHKTYRSKGEAVEALRGVTVHFGETGMVFILGKSGSGKSTLLHILGGLDRADSGRLEVDGMSTEGFSERDFDDFRNRSVGFAFQKLFNGRFVVSHNLHLFSEFLKKLHEVVGKTVIVVDHKEHLLFPRLIHNPV